MIRAPAAHRQNFRVHSFDQCSITTFLSVSNSTAARPVGRAVGHPVCSGRGRGRLDRFPHWCRTCRPRSLSPRRARDLPPGLREPALEAVASVRASFRRTPVGRVRSGRALPRPPDSRPRNLALPPARLRTAAIRAAPSRPAARLRALSGWSPCRFGAGVSVPPAGERCDGESLANTSDGGDAGWGWGSPPASAETTSLETCWPAPSSRRAAPTRLPRTENRLEPQHVPCRR